MHISVSGLGPDYQTSAAAIIRLFFHSAELTFSEKNISSQQKPSRADLSLDVRLFEPDNERLNVEVKLSDPKRGKTITRRHNDALGDGGRDEVARRKKTKHIVHVPLLEVLQQYTGTVQPWGILTGIRPTKLYHREKMAGASDRDVCAELGRRYLIREDKLDLLQTIVGRQLTAIPDLYNLRHEVSVYIGIPFCPTKCAYCTFPAYAIGPNQTKVDGFLAGLYYEMEKVGEWLKRNGVGITTIYFGGGTPTSISAEQMDRLYTHMRRVFPKLDHVREITVEAGRPDTITEQKLEVLLQHGIDRISINPQSYTEETLRAIGRHHTVEETVKTFWMAREKGMDNINMDLIIGLPGEGVDEFAHTLARSAELMPESLTVHTLSFKRASEMTRNKDKYKVADAVEVTEMMRMAQRWTLENGYSPYYLYRQKNILGNLENVGYAKPGKESLYNIMIMEEMQTIIGLGCGAASKWIDRATGKITRFANPKDPRSYNESFKRYTDAKIVALERLFEPAKTSMEA